MAKATGGEGGGGGGSNQQPSQQPPNQRIEVIKQYYNQLSVNLKNIVAQLNAPEITPQRRQALLEQQMQVQNSLQEFTERVLRPLANATAAGAQQQAQGSHQSAQQQVSRAVPLNGKAPSPPQAMVASSGSFSTPAAAAAAPPPHPPPVIFQNAPLPVRQALVVLQKQAQLIQQQQMIFQQKMMSKNFDSAPSRASVNFAAPRFDDIGEGNMGSFGLVSEPAVVYGDAHGLRARSGSKGRQVQELVADLSPDWRVSPEVEQAVLMIADEFIDQVAVFAASLAAQRKDTKLARRDLELALEKLGRMMLPGSHRSTVLGTSVKKLSRKPAGGQTNNPHHTRMAQLRKHLASLQQNTS